MYTLRKYIIVYMCDDTLKFVEAYCIAMQITQNGRLKYTFFFYTCVQQSWTTLAGVSRVFCKLLSACQ